MKTVVITGATGMIGVATTEECIKHGIKVYAIVRPNSKKLHRFPTSNLLKIIECDLSNLSMLSQLIFDKCDTFYHFAWGGQQAQSNENNEQSYMRRVEYNIDNITYNVDALKVAKVLGCSKFIGAGSQAEYGALEATEVATPDTKVNPQTPYGICKYAAGKTVMLKAKELDMQCVWVRIYSVYGELDRNRTMIKYAIRKFLNGERASFSEANQLWDYLYYKDAGTAFYLIGEKTSASKIYCLASGQSRPLRTYINEIKQYTNPDADIRFGEIRSDGSAINLRVDISDLIKDTGFSICTTFEEGIQNICNYMRKEL